MGREIQSKRRRDKMDCQEKAVTGQRPHRYWRNHAQEHRFDLLEDLIYLIAVDGH